MGVKCKNERGEETDRGETDTGDFKERMSLESGRSKKYSVLPGGCRCVCVWVARGLRGIK